MSDSWLIVAMMLVTFVPRYIPFALAGRIKLPPLLIRALNYVPIAILTAIIALNSLVQNNQVEFNLHNYHLLAAVAAALTAFFSRRLGLTVAVGLAVFVLCKWLAI